MHPIKFFCQQKCTLIIFFKGSVLEKYITKPTAMTISSSPAPPLSSTTIPTQPPVLGPVYEFGTRHEFCLIDLALTQIRKWLVPPMPLFHYWPVSTVCPANRHSQLDKTIFLLQEHGLYLPALRWQPGGMEQIGWGRTDVAIVYDTGMCHLEQQALTIKFGGWPKTMAISCKVWGPMGLR